MSRSGNFENTKKFIESWKKSDKRKRKVVDASQLDDRLLHQDAVRFYFHLSVFSQGESGKIQGI